MNPDILPGEWIKKKKMVVYPHNGILLTNKKQTTYLESKKVFQ